MLYVFWGLATLESGDINYSQPSLSSGNFSAYCFPGVLIPTAWGFTPHIHKPVFCQILGPCFYRQLQLPPSPSAPHSLLLFALCVKSCKCQWLQLPQTPISVSSSQQQQLGSIQIPSLLFCSLKSASKHFAGLSRGSPHLFPYPQGSWSYIIFCPMFEKQLFHIFCPVFFFLCVQPEGSSESLTLCWLKVEVSHHPRILELRNQVSLRGIAISTRTTVPGEVARILLFSGSTLPWL